MSIRKNRTYKALMVCNFKYPNDICTFLIKDVIGVRFYCHSILLHGAILTKEVLINKNFRDVGWTSVFPRDFNLGLFNISTKDKNISSCLNYVPQECCFYVVDRMTREYLEFLDNEMASYFNLNHMANKVITEASQAYGYDNLRDYDQKLSQKYLD